MESRHSRSLLRELSDCFGNDGTAARKSSFLQQRPALWLRVWRIYAWSLMYNGLCHWAASLLHTSFGQPLAVLPLRFNSPPSRVILPELWDIPNTQATAAPCAVARSASLDTA
jgi:hypothetical protein